jgi:hypothetical protein
MAPPPNPPLNTSKVIAGGMAAATSAVLGSYFGVFGTVGGAAAGSIATTVSTTLYQHSIERTRATLRSRTQRTQRTAVRPDPSPAPAAAPSDTGRRRDRPRHPILTLVVATFGLFVIGMVLLTGIEWVNGGSVFGDSPQRTSVTQVLGLTPDGSDGDRESDHDRQGNDRHRNEPGHGIIDQIPLIPPDVTDRPSPRGLG